MRKVLVTASSFRPLEVDLIKDRPELRIAATTDDRTLDDLIVSAVNAYEDYTNNILCSSTWDIYLDCFPIEDIEVPAPLISVSSVKYLDTSGTQQTLSTDYYKAVTSHNPIAGIISLKYGQSWESTYNEKDAVIIRIVAGYATPDAIPRCVKDGLIAKIQELYYGIDMSGKYHADWDSQRRITI